MSVTPRALLADATWYGTLAALRDLSRHGIAVTLGSDNWLAPARWSRHVSQTVSCPSTKGAAAFLAWLMSFGVEQPGHVLYPTSDEVAWLVAAHSDDLSRNFTLYTPPIGSLVQLLDKARLVDEATAAGLEVPETVVARNEAEVERCCRELQFPIFIKPRAQVFGRGVGKGVRVNGPSELCSSWKKQLDAAHYDASVIRHVPDINYPMLQRCVCGTERIYTVDGFVDETGDFSAMLACTKRLQRPRGSGPGIIFEHAELDPAIERDLRRLFRNTGFFGVFDAEFAEVGDQKLLIDINPRFYNHMAFEIERGLRLPLLAYLAAIGDRDALEAEISRFRNGSISRQAYIHRLPTRMLLAAQTLGGRMSAEDKFCWRRQMLDYRDSITDPVRTADDPAPALAEVALEAFHAVRHPRAYLRDLLKVPV